MKWLLSLLLWIWGIVSFLPRSLHTRWTQRKVKPFRRRKLPVFRYEHVDDFPDTLIPTYVYLAGEKGNLWAAAMMCPCGCGEVIELNLLKQARPCWSVREHLDGSVSVQPSIWRQKGCRSHFFVRNGRIDWC